MIAIGGVAAIIAGVGGIALSQLGSLIPKKRDFITSLKLKRVACIETHATSHCFLLKQFKTVGLEDFDNVMRGDDRTSRDYFLEFSKIAIRECNTFAVLNRVELKFRIAHWALLTSTIALIVLGAVLVVPALRFAYAPSVGGFLFAIELIAILMLYALADANEN